MNFAGVRKLPVVFVCENNRYAYSTPLEKQMAIDDVADRAAAYGFKGYVCSGNDLLAVLDVAEPVLARTREGGGPALIECKTYRYNGHSEHDPALYRSKEELLKWESRDPIQRFEFYLERRARTSNGCASRSTKKSAPSCSRRWNSPKTAPGPRSTPCSMTSMPHPPPGCSTEGGARRWRSRI